MAQSPAEEHKAAGNDAFKAGDYLKAAAAYTKAIKADPANHVYYSNRSQAFRRSTMPSMPACSCLTSRCGVATGR